MNGHGPGTQISVTPNFKFQCGSSAMKFYGFYRTKKARTQGNLKIQGGAIEVQLEHYDGRFSIGPRCCPMAILALTLVEASGLRS